MNVYEIVTNLILSQLEGGHIPWRKPWVSRPAQNYITGKPYRGINALLLNSLGFASHYFLTYRQSREAGGFVRKGERGIPVVFYNFVDDEENDKKMPFLRYYSVFNISQCDGISVPDIEARPISPIESCEQIIGKMPNAPTISFGGNSAFYSPSSDSITIPARERFAAVQEYYSTLNHELVHASGHASRLNRPGITETANFGSEVYSKEELIAELGASFLNSHAGIVGTTLLQNSAAYIGSWLKVLKNDKRMIVSASSEAQKACDYILNIKPTE